MWWRPCSLLCSDGRFLPACPCRRCSLALLDSAAAAGETEAPPPLGNARTDRRPNDELADGLADALARPIVSMKCGVPFRRSISKHTSLSAPNVLQLKVVRTSRKTSGSSTMQPAGAHLASRAACVMRSFTDANTHSVRAL